MTAKRRSHMPSMPVGTVTFLFTDIEGSTKLWETQHDAREGNRRSRTQRCGS
jgi:class 3 adenylate cyclase